MKKVNVASFGGNGIRFHSGNGKISTIKPYRLKEIRSKVRTHEGELLRGAEGRKYMDKYSKKYLGRDLEGSYNDQKIIGHVPVKD